MTAFLFLDFDGVLHPKGCCAEEQFIHRPRLESVLRDFPLVRVVISSSWQEAYSIAALRVRFSDDIQQRIIGVTASDERSRYYQIQDYLQRTWPHGVRWVALGGAAEEFPARCPELVLCDPAEGFDLDAERELRGRLNPGSTPSHPTRDGLDRFFA